MAESARRWRSPELSLLGEQVRRHDRDRFVTALFASQDRREDLFALYAFNADVAGIPRKGFRAHDGAHATSVLA